MRKAADNRDSQRGNSACQAPDPIAPRRRSSRELLPASSSHALTFFLWWGLPLDDSRLDPDRGWTVHFGSAARQSLAGTALPDGELVKNGDSAPRIGVILAVLHTGSRSQSSFFHKLEGWKRVMTSAPLRRISETKAQCGESREQLRTQGVHSRELLRGVVANRPRIGVIADLRMKVGFVEPFDQ